MVVENESTETTVEEKTQGQESDFVSTEVEEDSGPESDDASEDTTVDEPEEKTEYQPDFSYKVYGEDREIPEEFRTLIKDKESEDRIRTILSKADGLDGMKPRHEKIVSERDELRNSLDQTYTKLRDYEENRERDEYYRKNDLGLFLKSKDISEDEILDHAARILDARDSVSVKNQMSERQSMIAQNFDANRQVSSLESQANNLAFQQHNFLMDQALADPQVNEFVKAYDTKMGKEGAFREKVEMHGDYLFRTQNRYLVPGEVVKQVHQELSQIFVPATSQQQGYQQQTTAPTQRPKTLPNLGSSGTVSAVRKRPGSVDELRAMAEARIAELDN